MDETISQVNPAGISGRGGSGMKRFILPLIILLILGGLIFGGVSFLRSRGEAIPTPTPVPTAEPTQEPSPTPEATPSATQKAKATPTKKPTATPTKAATSSAESKGLTVRVLNGTDIARRAAGAADFLKGLGYEIAGTGNADTQDFEKATITIKSSKESLLATLKKDLETKYAVGTTSATLSSSADYDAVVTVGKQ